MWENNSYEKLKCRREIIWEQLRNYLQQRKKRGILRKKYSEPRPWHKSAHAIRRPILSRHEMGDATATEIRLHRLAEGTSFILRKTLNYISCIYVYVCHVAARSTWRCKDHYLRHVHVQIWRNYLFRKYEIQLSQLDCIAGVYYNL